MQAIIAIVTVQFVSRLKFIFKLYAGYNCYCKYTICEQAKIYIQFVCRLFSLFILFHAYMNIQFDGWLLWLLNLSAELYTSGCLSPHGPAGITRRKSEEGHRKYRMKITHFGANLKVDHLGSNHQAQQGTLLPICLTPCVAQLWSNFNSIHLI